MFFRMVMLLIIAASSLAYAQPASTDITHYTLDNGLTILVKPDHRTPIVTTYVYYKVGSADENTEQTGLSHALEHMMFKGTYKVSGDDFSRINAKFGGQNNAFTTQTVTAYYQTYPSQYVGLALELEADRMQNLKLQQADFEKEMQVVMEERRQRTDDNPKATAYERFRLAAYPTSPLRLPVIGYMNRLKKLNLSQLQQWYSQWYSPNNAIVVVVGDVDPAEVFALSKQYFGAIPAKVLPRRVATDEMLNFGQRELSFFLPIKVPSLYMAWNVPSVATADDTKNAYALLMLNEILDGGLSARLEKIVIRQNRLATAAGSSYDPFNRGGALFMISAVPEAGITLAQLQDGITKQIQRFKTELVSQDELDKVTRSYIASMVYTKDSISNQARLIGDLAAEDLDYTLSDQLPMLLKQVTPADIKRVANTYLVHSNLTYAYLAPPKPVSRANSISDDLDESAANTNTKMVYSPDAE